MFRIRISFHADPDPLKIRKHKVLHTKGLSRENWLSHVIQATWEARTMGWLEVERLLPSADGDSVAALPVWPPYLGKVYRGGMTPMTREGQAAPGISRNLRSSPSQT